jgi:membrane protein required for colicin V production
MNWLDIVIIVLLIVSAFSGFASGLIKSVFSLAGMILGVMLAGRFYVALAGNLGFITNETAARIVAFIIIFLVIMIVAAILGSLFTKLVSAIMLGWLNRLGGAALGIVLGGIFIGAILTLWVKFGGISGALTESAIAPILLDKIPVVMALFPQEFNSVRQFFQ